MNKVQGMLFCPLGAKGMKTERRHIWEKRPVLPLTGAKAGSGMSGVPRALSSFQNSLHAFYSISAALSKGGRKEAPRGAGLPSISPKQSPSLMLFLLLGPFPVILTQFTQFAQIALIFQGSDRKLLSSRNFRSWLVTQCSLSSLNT